MRDESFVLFYMESDNRCPNLNLELFCSYNLVRVIYFTMLGHCYSLHIVRKKIYLIKLACLILVV